MSDEPFDAAKVAAECKAKIGRPRKKGEAPAIPVVEAKRGGTKAPLDDDDGFHPTVVAMITRLVALGATEQELAEACDVRKETFKKWTIRYPELAEAVKLGRDYAAHRTARSMFERANGYTYFEEQAFKIKTSKDTEEVKIVEVKRMAPPDVVACMHILTNLDRENWQHRKVQDHTGEISHKVTPAKAREELARWMKGEAAPAPAKAASKPH